MARPRKPTAVKKLSGTAKVNPGRLNKKEPTLPVAKPDQDLSHLSPEGQEFWPKFAGILERMGVLTFADGPSLVGLVESFADLARARKYLKTLDSPYVESVNENGDTTMIRAHPVLAQIADADRRYMAWASRFGLTPADRSRVAANLLEESKNPFDGI